MQGNKRWRAAIAGSLLLHVGLFAAISLFWHWDVMQARQPIYVEVSMAELFAPVDGPAGGGGQPERSPEPERRQPSSAPAAPSQDSFSEHVAAKTATKVRFHRLPEVLAAEEPAREVVAAGPAVDTAAAREPA